MYNIHLDKCITFAKLADIIRTWVKLFPTISYISVKPVIYVIPVIYSVTKLNKNMLLSPKT